MAIRLHKTASTRFVRVYLPQEDERPLITVEEMKAMIADGSAKIYDYPDAQVLEHNKMQGVLLKKSEKAKIKDILTTHRKHDGPDGDGKFGGIEMPKPTKGEVLDEDGDDDDKSGYKNYQQYEDESDER